MCAGGSFARAFTPAASSAPRRRCTACAVSSRTPAGRSMSPATSARSSRDDGGGTTLDLRDAARSLRPSSRTCAESSPHSGPCSRSAACVSLTDDGCSAARAALSRMPTAGSSRSGISSRAIDAGTPAMSSERNSPGRWREVRTMTAICDQGTLSRMCASRMSCAMCAARADSLSYKRASMTPGLVLVHCGCRCARMCSRSRVAISSGRRSRAAYAVRPSSNRAGASRVRAVRGSSSRLLGSSTRVAAVRIACPKRRVVRRTMTGAGSRPIVRKRSRKASSPPTSVPRKP